MPLSVRAVGCLRAERYTQTHHMLSHPQGRDHTELDLAIMRRHVDCARLLIRAVDDSGNLSGQVDYQLDDPDNSLKHEL